MAEDVLAGFSLLAAASAEKEYLERA